MSTAANSPARYKVDIAGVSPVWRRNEFEKDDLCFLGVSLENPKFTPPKVAAMAEWVSRRFSQCTVLVGDSIHRITLEATRSMPAEAAATEAMRLGREFVETQRSVFEEYQERCKFSVLPCSEVQTWPDCPAYYAALLDSFESQPEFRKSVENFSRIYHDRREEKLDPGEYEWRVNRSSHYFLEEFAIFCCLRQRGFRVMVYPGSFSTLAEVAEGGHPGVPAELSDITVVSLHLKGRRG